MRTTVSVRANFHRRLFIFIFKNNFCRFKFNWTLFRGLKKKMRKSLVLGGQMRTNCSILAAPSVKRAPQGKGLYHRRMRNYMNSRTSLSAACCFLHQKEATRWPTADSQQQLSSVVALGRVGRGAATSVGCRNGRIPRQMQLVNKSIS